MKATRRDCRVFGKVMAVPAPGSNGSRRAGLWRRAGMLVGGVAALIWLLVRTGAKPSRLSYPCQQTALATATTMFGAPAIAFVYAKGGKMSLRRGVIATATLAIVGIAAGLFTMTTGSFDLGYPAEMLIPPADYRPSIFMVDDVRGVEPGRFGGVDDLITLMGVYGNHWHRTESVALTSGPDGMIDRDDVVLLKVNGQWSQRGGTNTDLLRGVIRRIMEHPDGFIGEVVVADNGQGSGDLDRSENNAEDHGQSAQDVVNDFAAEGWRVSTALWDQLRYVSVSEYSDGDKQDGYVVNAEADPQTLIKVSYPKFETVFGTYLSYKHGIWDDASETYDAARLVVINMPVLKTHSIYGVTAAVKNHMGVVTRFLGTDAHNAVGRGGMGSVLADVRMPDLTILDCIWVLARPGMGPGAAYENATRTNTLLASWDPVVLDVWAVKHILIPEIIANGYGLGQYYATQDPDNPDSKFRRYLDRSMNELLLADIATTNNAEVAIVYRWGADYDRDGDVDSDDFRMYVDCFGGPGIVPAADCQAFDFDDDADIDLRDFSRLQQVHTGPMF